MHLRVLKRSLDHSGHGVRVHNEARERRSVSVRAYLRRLYRDECVPYVIRHTDLDWCAVVVGDLLATMSPCYR